VCVCVCVENIKKKKRYNSMTDFMTSAKELAKMAAQRDIPPMMIHYWLAGRKFLEVFDAKKFTYIYIYI
jgi:hypothetical protein